MKTLGSPESVADAVAEEAAREIERLLRDADAEVRRLREEGETADVTPRDRAARLAAAHREVSSRLAREDWEDRCAALQERERWAERAIRLARERFDAAGQPASRRELLLALALEGAGNLPPGAIEVASSAVDAPLVDDSLVAEIARRSGRPCVPASGADRPQSGCVVSTSGGKIRFDNSLEARARRFEPAWRAALTEIYGP